MASVYILRHGQAIHNIERGYPHRDPPLTELGITHAKSVKAMIITDLILVSPMTRTIETTLLVFSSMLQGEDHAGSAEGKRPEVQIWPELREAHDAICNKGVSKSEMAAKFPQFDFSRCNEEWNYPPHTFASATARAEEVRSRIRRLSDRYRTIVLVTHRGFAAFLAKGERFEFCEYRCYRFASDEEAKEKDQRFSLNQATGLKQDFGPSLLLPHQ